MPLKYTGGLYEVGKRFRKEWYILPHLLVKTTAMLVQIGCNNHSIILTSNKAPDQWSDLMGDQGITTAILDRLLHRVEVIQMDGESYRMKHKEKIFKS